MARAGNGLARACRMLVDRYPVDGWWLGGGVTGHLIRRAMGSSEAAIDVYDPKTDSWSRAPDLPKGHSHAEGGTFVHDGRIYMVGGHTTPKGGTTCGPRRPPRGCTHAVGRRIFSGSCSWSGLLSSSTLGVRSSLGYRRESARESP